MISFYLEDKNKVALYFLIFNSETTFYHMKKILILIGIFITTFASAQEKASESPVITIKVPLGKTITVDGLNITFNKVLEDSRCPEDVTCIWAGRAKVQVTVTKNSGERVEKEMIFGEVKPDETNDLILAKTQNYSYKGVQLNPYPTSSGGEKDYVLLISKEEVK